MANKRCNLYDVEAFGLPCAEQVGSGSNGLLLRGDCLSACAELQRRGISPDVIYIDPPFASSKSYFKPLYLRPPLGQVLPTSAKLTPDLQARVFRDCLEPDEFIAWLEPQIVALHGVLAAQGCFFLHLDHHISHYARVLLDRIFGRDNFRNEIIWSYRTGGVSKRTFAQKHDTIFFYSKSAEYCFNPQYYRSYQARRYNYNPKYPELWDEKAQRWYHLAVCRDVWDDINVIGTERDGSERLDYPTQKPEALLERLIASTTQEGQTVADFFGGSGVCAAVAHRLGRRFVHSDVSPISIATCRQRLLSQGASFGVEDLEPPPSECSGHESDRSGHESDRSGHKSERSGHKSERSGHEGVSWRCSWERPLDSSTAFGQLEINFNAEPDVARLFLHQYHNQSLEQGLGRELPTGLETVEWVSADCTASLGPWHSDIEAYIDPSGRAWQNQREIPWDGSLPCPNRPHRLRIRDISGRDTVAGLELPPAVGMA